MTLLQQAAEKVIEPNWKNKTLFLGDNLHIMRRMNSSLMDLIYLDPPFNTGRKFRAPIGSAGEIEEVFSDIWREEDLDQLEHALLAQYNGAGQSGFNQSALLGHLRFSRYARQMDVFLPDYDEHALD